MFLHPSRAHQHCTTSTLPCHQSCIQRATRIYHPRPLYEAPDRFQHILDLKEVCNGVVHPITEETITKYMKLMNDSNLKYQWVPVILKNSNTLPRGNSVSPRKVLTPSFFSHDKSRCIPKDCTVTYACIIVDHWPQKDNLNHVSITVGNNLINYPCELITHTANMVSAKMMWNSVASMPGAKFGGADIKHLYL